MASAKNREMDISGPAPSRPDIRLQGVSASFAEHGATEIEDSLAAQQLDLLGPAYVLEWSDKQRRCSRKHLDSSGDLRAGLLQAGKQDGRRLFVIQGLPMDYLEVLQDLLHVDARFIDAHVGRRGYRPLTPPRTRQWVGDDAYPEAQYACFEYPELLTPRDKDVTDEKQILAVKTPGAGVGASADIVGDPPLLTISRDGDIAMFCRVSLWLGSEAAVLFLDRPAWTRHNPNFQKARYRDSHVSAAGNKLRDGPNEIPCFETLLYESLAEEAGNGKNATYADICVLTEAIAAHQWAEFFEALPSGAPETEYMAPLYWQAQASLERNLRSSKPCVVSPRDNPTSDLTAEWEAFLARLTRRAALASHLTPSVTTLAIPTSHTKPFSADGVPPATSHRHRPSNTNQRPPQSSAEEANQHSLDRVSYMGGILLPFSIVSGILSMSDPFGPGGGMFFVFWAVSVPLVIVAILIIYADSIRRAEVWIEVSAGSSAGGSEKPSLDEAEAGVATAVPYSVAAAVASAPAGGLGVRITAVGDDGEEEEIYPEDFDEQPVMMVEKAFRNPGRKKWHKEQLGWMGACKTALRIYKLKKGRPPPNWAGVRRGRTA